MLTPKQRKLLGYIHSHTVQNDGISPSYEDMKSFMGLKSKSGVFDLVKALEERGFIKKIAHKARAIEVTRLPCTPVVATPQE